MLGSTCTPDRSRQRRSMASRASLFQAKLTPSYEHIRSWLAELPGPVAVAYEAGPTGFGLYRHLTAAGIRCEVVAPSKLQKPAGERVKTDAKDAVHLARLLRLDEFTAVAIPTVDQEAARDLVRAREDCRGDLMRARHRLSKLLLRHGIVYYGGEAWTSKHDVWLRTEALPQLTTRSTTAGVRLRLRDRARHQGAPGPARCRDRGDGRRLGVHPDRAAAGLPARHRHPDRVRAGRRDRRLAPVHRQHHRLLRRPRPQRTLLRPSRARARSPRPATDTPAGCSSRPPGTTGPATPSAPPCATAGTSHPPQPGSAATRATAGCTTAGSSSSTAEAQHHRRRRDRPRTRRLVLVPGRDGGLDRHRTLRCRRPVDSAWSDPRPQL